AAGTAASSGSGKLTGCGIWRVLGGRPHIVSRLMRRVMLMLAAVLAVAVSSCGGGGGSSDSGLGMPPKVPPVTEFPKVKGRTMTELAASLQPAPVLAASVSLPMP